MFCPCLLTAPRKIVCARGFPGVFTSQFLYINDCFAESEVTAEIVDYED